MLLYDKKSYFVCVFLLLVSFTTTICYRGTNSHLPYSQRFNWRHNAESVNPLRGKLISQENFDRTFDLVFGLMDQDRKLFSFQ